MAQHTNVDVPNILWICTDQQRADTIHALGNPTIRTPHIDRLCAEGVAFTRAYCQSPICTPSRASFLTGRYPSGVGVNSNGNPSFPEDVPLVTKKLADRGYRCGLIGKLHLASPFQGVEQRVNDGYDLFRYSHDPWQPLELGNDYAVWLRQRGLSASDVFDRMPDGGYRGYGRDAEADVHQTTWCAEEATAFIEAEHEGPWLLSVNIFDPHVPFDAPRAYAEPYLGAQLPAPRFRETDLLQQQRLQEAGVYFQTALERPSQASHARTASYYGMITLIDEAVGKMLAALARTGQRERTVVVFMSDHGEMLGDHSLVRKGCRFYEGLVRVPLIVSWPGHFREGAEHHDLVELTDLAPTLTELAGMTLEEVDGTSLLESLVNGAPHPREYVRCEYLDALHPELPEHPERHRPSHGSMFFDGIHKLVVYHGHGTGELYDLSQDPDEFCNLWDRPSAAMLKNELMHRSFDVSMMVSRSSPQPIGPF